MDALSARVYTAAEVEDAAGVTLVPRGTWTDGEAVG